MCNENTLESLLLLTLTRAGLTVQQSMHNNQATGFIPVLEKEKQFCIGQRGV